VSSEQNESVPRFKNKPAKNTNRRPHLSIRHCKYSLLCSRHSAWLLAWSFMQARNARIASLHCPPWSSGKLPRAAVSKRMGCEGNERMRLKMLKNECIRSNIYVRRENGGCKTCIFTHQVVREAERVVCSWLTIQKK
jgi:hypothetical protein